MTIPKPRNSFLISFLILFSLSSVISAATNAEAADAADAADTRTESEFINPPFEYGTWVYWWWLNGWIDEAGIEADLDHMKEMGISGALVFNAGRGKTPFNTPFMGERWRELFRYAVEQAALRDIEIGLNLCNGWGMGGPWITEEFAISNKKRITMGGAGGGSGFEVDPYNPAAVDLHWENTMQVILEEAGEEWVDQYVGSTFKYTHTDSWERGYPEKSPVMAEEFEKRRGYPLGSQSGERYTEDFNSARTEIWADNYYGRLTELSHELGLQTHSEAGGWEYSLLLDAPRYFGTQDIVMCEFWSRPSRGGNGFRQVRRNDWHDHIKTASSSAHTYGKDIVQAEAYTLWPRLPAFSMTFWEMKDVGDRAFCLGVNRNVFHHMIAQAGNDDSKLGAYVWENVGFEFTRKNILWPMGKAFLDYKNRVQYLLQRDGTYVADFLYFHGNTVPVVMPSTHYLKPELPSGYDADMVNAHALLTRASAKDERVTFPDGQSYKYLVLKKNRVAAVVPEGTEGNVKAVKRSDKFYKEFSDTTDALTVEVMEKLYELVKGGVTLIGPAPSRSFGYEGYPENLDQFEVLKTTLWGENPSESGWREVGAGRVIWGSTLQEVVDADKLLPDLAITEHQETDPRQITGTFGPGFDYIHRKIDHLDVYFIANLRNLEASGDFVFRNAQTPQIWDAVDGSMWSVPQAKHHENGTVEMMLKFEPRQSFFVIFGNENTGKPAFHGNEFVFDHAISGPWEVNFDPARGGPASVQFPELMDWTEHPDTGVKYYSGTATYTKRFDLPEDLRGSERPVILNLGTIKEMAEVTLNGKNLGIVWSAPFQLDISSAVKDTGNVLEIDVVNVLSNRKLGDSLLDEDYTIGTGRLLEEPLPSGLLGPVKLGQIRHNL